MATPSPPGPGRGASEGARELSRQLASESKLAPLTTEFWAFVLAVVAILIAGAASGDGFGSDAFNANRVWLYVTILTAAYILSRGLAKSGTRREQTGLEKGAPAASAGRREPTPESPAVPQSGINPEGSAERREGI